MFKRRRSSISSNHNDSLHWRNPLHQYPPNFTFLASLYPETLEKVLLRKGNGETTVDWTNANAVSVLNQTLLHYYFGLSLSYPNKGLCPPVANRTNYLCWLADLLAEPPPPPSVSKRDSTRTKGEQAVEAITQNKKNDPKISIESENSLIVLGESILQGYEDKQSGPRVLDIGCGPLCIYAAIGATLFPHWNFLCSDVERESLQWARSCFSRGDPLSKKISLVQVKGSDDLQSLILKGFESEEIKEINGSHSCVDRVEKRDKSFLEFYFQEVSSSIDDADDDSLEIEFSDGFKEKVNKMKYRVNRGPIIQALLAKKFAKSDDPQEQSAEITFNNEMIQLIKKLEKRCLLEFLRNKNAHICDNTEENKEKDSEKVFLSVTMVNPPFYDMKEQILENKNTVCSGTEREMRTIGGEVCFVYALIADSLILKDRVGWYTSLLGKKSSISRVTLAIRFQTGLPPSHVKTTTFTQGQTHRWGVAWTFCPFCLSAAEETLRLSVLKQKEGDSEGLVRVNEKKTRVFESGLGSENSGLISFSMDLPRFLETVCDEDGFNENEEILENIKNRVLKVILDFKNQKQTKINLGTEKTVSIDLINFEKNDKSEANSEFLLRYKGEKEHDFCFIKTCDRHQSPRRGFKGEEKQKSEYMEIKGTLFFSIKIIENFIKIEVNCSEQSEHRAKIFNLLFNPIGNQKIPFHDFFISNFTRSNRKWRRYLQKS